MGFYFESFITEIILGVIFFGALLLLYFFRSFSFWSRKGIPYLKPNFPFGNFKSIILRQKTIGVAIHDIYKELKQRGVKYGGYYALLKPTFLAIDPEIIKQIMIKDFNSFQDRGIYCDEVNEPISAHLFSIGGQKWRNLRAKLSPTFTSGKMKMMFQTLVSCSTILETVLEDINKKSEPIDIKEISARFTTDVIGLCAFGLECNSLQNPEAKFRQEGRKIFDLGFVDGIKNLIAFIKPDLLKFLHLTVNKPETSIFFMDILKQTVDYREQNNIDRKDMLNLLIKLKNNVALDDEKIGNDNNGNAAGAITFNELVAQCFVFFVAGFETSSTTMTFALFELCLHQEIQDKLRKEIRTVLAKHKGETTYEAIMEMHYLDKVINETLRKYPALPLLNRECNHDWTIPGTNKVLEKGSAIVISNLGMQMDPDYYPNPEKFDPERFSEEEKAKRPACTYMPFGDGPRNCIGMRFGLLQTKVGLVSCLKNHRFTLDPKTIQPIQYDVNMIVLSHKYGIWLQSTRS